jgi:hypothetical protein
VLLRWTLLPKRSARLAPKEESSSTRCVTRYKLNFGETAREAVFLFAHLRCPLLAQSGHR